MQLLVSVRSAAEADAALSGGADIIDAKEPQHGSLGPVSPATLAEILALVPSDRPFSIALGDLATPEGAISAIRSLSLPDRAAPTYLKLGFAGVCSARMVRRILRSTVSALSDNGSPALVVAVAYADAARTGTLSPDQVVGPAQDAGASGVLLDTHAKEGAGLLGWMTTGALAGWVDGARREGLLTAVAGSLALENLGTVVKAGGDIIGVRGAACQGGRQGQVQAHLVRALRGRLDFFGFSSLPAAPSGGRSDGETREGAANPLVRKGPKFRKTNA